MRSADENPDEILVVDPHGRVRSCIAAEAVHHAIVHEDGTVRDDKARRGFVRLDDMYEDDDLGERGYAVYLEWRAARKAGKQGEMPDHWLPAEMLRRRKARKAATTWQAPPADAQIEAPPKRQRKRRRTEHDAKAEHRAIDEAERARELKTQALANATAELYEDGSPVDHGDLGHYAEQA